jgi:Xaa-Pro aminopeptidase
MDISKIQHLLSSSHLDGWLFSDFHGHDFISQEFLHLTGRRSTRRLFYYIPACGEPVKILSSIEPLLLDHLPGRKVLCHGIRGQKEALSEILLPGRRIACQYSPGGNVPTVSSMDAGLIEYLKSFGIELVSSADLLQHFGAVLTDAQVESHRLAGIIIHRILDQTFDWIRTSLNEGHEINEWMMLRKMEELISREPIYMDAPPFFGIDAHACDPGYEPTAENSSSIREGSRLIIDIAGRLPAEDSIYYDVSWCMNVGSQIDPEYQRLFDLVHHTRMEVLQFIQDRLDHDLPVRGCEADALAQSIIREHGFGGCLMHRTGHSIGHTCHGIGANLDDYETHDDRCLLPGTMFSIEPGIYTDTCGVRLEFDVHITPDKKTRIYGPIQEQIRVI